MMSKYKLADLKRAEESIADFDKRFMTVMTFTDKKGLWTCRCTRKNVQIFLVTGQTLFECIINASNKTLEKRQTLGV